ncbi:hypothetical protein CHH28_16430 [Bacterioplanes sanyensis]|uniref:Uncharacterized protein n=1 Tax=Bacterioplanes sanyensis TaxID=1249553 RepID=A0A222FNT0_9GAMM|nr:hypothetical protein [Bacterioplanes sanyensis]ASP40164.1 hypothetical protein CHH28_16430 [Bacterioplanes sanyensis]
MIEVHTEWLDASGYPLPAGLKGRGFTGRVTRQVANDGDVFDSGVKEFAIDPGRQLQKLDFDNNQAYHHYVQVNAEPEGEQNDFSTGDHTGVLRHRPSRYVPVKVPLYDEQSTEFERSRLAQDSSLDSRDITPHFNWVHRPELSFSVIDLTMQEINLQSENEDGTVERINLIDDTAPVINSADDLVELVFQLTTSQYQRITPLEAKREYIFSLGDFEVMFNVTPGDDGQQRIVFDNLEHLAELDVEDYLSLSLYLNHDAQNALWEWGFTTLDVDIDSDNDNGTDEPDRSLPEEAIETTDQHPSKRIRLNMGDINGNDIPDFAEFEYLNTKGEQVNKKFVPFVVEIPTHVPIAKGQLTFVYSGSDPLLVQEANDPAKEGKKIYTPAPGSQRLWKKNADKKRSPKGLQQGGDYLTPNTGFTLEELGYSDNKRVQTWYIEALQRSGFRGARVELVLEYDQ